MPIHMEGVPVLPAVDPVLPIPIIPAPIFVRWQKPAFRGFRGSPPPRLDAISVSYVGVVGQEVCEFCKALR